MSLLMEALRKAEEAKSKAVKKEDQEPDGTEETQDAPPASTNPDSLPGIQATETVDETESDLGSLVTEDGPVVINPEPDELETLAAHAGDDGLSFIDSTSSKKSEGDTQENTERQENDPAPEPFPESKLALEPMPVEETEPPIISDSLDPDFDKDKEDALSLLESSYFSRTKNPGNRGFDDDLDFDPKSAAVTPDEDPVNEPSLDSAISNNLQDFPGNADEAPVEAPIKEKSGLSSEENINAAPENVDTKKAEEQKKRSSANALFKAKTGARQNQRRKILPIAALILIFPLGGVIYWFYSSYTSTPQVQFAVPANGGLAERGFLGGESEGTGTTEEAVEQELLAGGVLDEQAGTDSLPEQTLDQTQTPSEEELSFVEQATQIAQVDTQPPAPENTVVTATSPQANPNPAGQNNALANSQQNVPVQQAASGLSFVRTEVENIINPDLSAAYGSYQQGDYNVAGRLYQQVLNSEPNNRDAMLGLASVYLKQNNFPMTQNLYARLLELNPRDPIARAGLLEISMQDDPVRQESELKSMVSAFPGVAPISFALGNLFARQNRWSEAQSAYFNALLVAKSDNTSAAVSPDYAFNLAVSLEQLNQLSSALDFYREAEEFSRDTVPGFDITLLNQRINILEQRLP